MSILISLKGIIELSVSKIEPSVMPSLDYPYAIEKYAETDYRHAYAKCLGGLMKLWMLLRYVRQRSNNCLILR